MLNMFANVPRGPRCDRQPPGITWDEATFAAYIENPREKIRGTKMIYAGLKDQQRIRDLIAYLKQFDASGEKK